MTVAGQNQYATGTASEATGSRPVAVSRGVAPANPSGTFLSLLFQDQLDSNGNASSVSTGGAGSSCIGAGVTQETKKPLALLASPISTETQTVSKRKKATGESDATPALVTQSIDLSAAARWLLSLTGGNASTVASAASLGSGVDAESRTRSSGQMAAAASPAREDNKVSDTGSLLTTPEGPTGRADNAIKGATLGALDVAPIAELHLTPSAIPSATSRVAAAESTHPLTLSSATSTSKTLQAVSAVGSQSIGETERDAVSEARAGDLDHGGESSPDRSATSQQAVFAVSKKKAEADSAQRDEPAAISNPGGSNQRASTWPTATPPAESQNKRAAADAPAAAPTVLEPASTELSKPAASSVGRIELQVKGSDEQQVGLRFVERQGRVEIQLKSGDLHTAQALSDNLAGLKTSLNENGWTVESRIQDRLFSASQEPQAVSAADQPGSPQTLRAEQSSMGQMNQRSGSDSSVGKGHSGPDQDGSSSGNGHHAQKESAGSNSEQQGRRSASNSEAWLESIESNLTRFPSSRITTGVTQ